MAVATGFSNSWTSGEIFEDVDDRTDIQPVAKGCAQATNLIVQNTGPLKKRRGFWYLGGVANAAKAGRLIPFRRSISDALMLELGDSTCRVWSANGAPLLSGGAQVQFATPFASTVLATLRYKQVADVIYFTSSNGMQPQALERLTDSSWAFNALTFPNGPWLAENIDDTKTVTVTGTAITDATGSISPAAGAIHVGQAVTITANSAIFSAANVGDSFKIRATTGSASVMSWSPGFNTPVGCFRLSVGNIYVSTYDYGSGGKANATNPPVQTDGSQSDGCSTFAYLHDGAGIVQITGYTSPTVVTGTVTACLPIGSGVATSYYSFSAYGAANGWPRAWPSAVEERLAFGAVAGNLDFIDLTRTAGFTPLKADFHPGLGTGQVVATDALRRRLGDDGGEILWTRQATFLIAGTASGEYVISGGLFGDPLSPSTIICRPISAFGSYDVYPALLEKGLAYVARGGQSLRTIRLDLQQNDSGQDMSFLAHHIETRLFVQLAWVPAPDRVLWARLGDGGLAAFTIHEEQGVKGWTTQSLAAPAAGALTIEDIVTLPGPGKFETLWMIVSGQMGGAFQRFLMMQSQVSDGLLGMDVAALYAGAPTSEVGGLDYLDGETVRILAGGVAQLPQTVVSGMISVPAGSTRVLVGLPWAVTFQSLKLDVATLGGTLLARQRVAGCSVDVLGTYCQIGYPGALKEASSSRQAGDALTGPVARRFTDRVTFGGDFSTDARIQITEDTPYDFGIYALRPIVVSVGGGQGG